MGGLRLFCHRARLVGDAMTNSPQSPLPWSVAAASDRKDILRCIELAGNSFPVDSRYAVGAVIYTRSGGKYEGVNFEDGAGLAICAERAALVAALTAGDPWVSRVVVAGLYPHEPLSCSFPCAPCGHCRQALLRLANEQSPSSNVEIVYFDPSRLEVYRSDIRSLLPSAYTDKRDDLREWRRSAQLSLADLVTKLCSSSE